MWVISDGRRYVGKDNQCLTCDINKSMKFSTPDKASNFMCNMKRTYQTYNWQVIPMREATKEDRKQNIKIVKDEPTVEAVKKNDNKIATVFEQEGFSWDSHITNMELFFAQIDTYKRNLENAERKVERECCDIRHATEFAVKANVVEGNKLFRQQRDKLQERRHIKDELTRVSIIQESTLDDIHSGKVSRRLAGMDDRTYAPREMPELFQARYIVM